MTVSEDNFQSMLKFLFFPMLFWAVSINAQKDSTTFPKPEPPAPVESAPHKTPEFPGGHRAFVTEVLKNFRTSPLVRAEIMSAKASANFIVDTEGNMIDIKIESYEHAMVRDEFLRALKMVKTKWIPAEQDGKKVRSVMRQPLIFNLK
ncbi:hypothetical protein BBH99_09465 [Chryseobacterium contaminans]|uniref:TonB protein C-terminal n=2 Tax=Chryseobacterium contaminans TaxID=1423959 RepID=A0ABX2X4T2_9FLAO|nr:hypothetical protein BBH99_09465 [Chryseobacterium contaminans]